MTSTPDNAIRVPDAIIESLGVLGAPARIEILVELGGSPRSVGELCDRLDLGMTTVSQNLRRLRKAGLVACVARRQQRIYTLTDSVQVQCHGELVLVVRIGGTSVRLGMPLATARRAPSVVVTDGVDRPQAPSQA